MFSLKAFTLACISSIFQVAKADQPVHCKYRQYHKLSLQITTQTCHNRQRSFEYSVLTLGFLPFSIGLKS